MDEGSYTDPSKLTVSAWLDIWLAEYVEGTVKFTTYSSYQQICRTHICTGLGATLLTAIEPLDIQKFYNKLRKKGLSPKTIRNVHGVLHRALEEAIAAKKVRRTFKAQ